MISRSACQVFKLKGSHSPIPNSPSVHVMHHGHPAQCITWNEINSQLISCAEVKTLYSFKYRYNFSFLWNNFRPFILLFAGGGGHFSIVWHECTWSYADCSLIQWCLDFVTLTVCFSNIDHFNLFIFEHILKVVCEEATYNREPDHPTTEIWVP
jgi:hypothetical protein